MKDSDDEEAPDLDPLDAAALKAKMKQKAMKEKRMQRGEDVRRVRFADGQEEDEALSDDSSELMYDSEEEAEIEQEAFLAKFQKDQIEKAKASEQIDTAGYDIGKELALMQKFKAAPGVKFMAYDEFGLPNTAEAKELRKFISTEETAPDAMVIEAPPEQMEKALRPTGVRYDYDKQVDEMNAEGKSNPDVNHRSGRAGDARRVFERQ